MLPTYGSFLVLLIIAIFLPPLPVRLIFCLPFFVDADTVAAGLPEGTELRVISLRLAILFHGFYQQVGLTLHFWLNILFCILFWFPGKSDEPKVCGSCAFE